MRGSKHLRAFERTMQARNLSPKTRKLHLTAARRFLLDCGKEPRRITRRDVEAHLAALDELGLSTGSRANALEAIRAFCRYLVDEGVLVDDPTERMRIKRERSAPLLLSEEGVQRLMTVASANLRYPVLGLRDRALVELLYCLALRASEACVARVVDLDLTAGTLLVRRAKRGQPDRLPLPPSGLAEIRRYLEESRPRLVEGKHDLGYLIVTRRGKPLYPNDPNSILYRVGKRAGIRVHPHAFRRACATHLVEAGVSVRSVQVLLGHASLEATELYVGVSREALRRVVAVLEC